MYCDPFSLDTQTQFRYTPSPKKQCLITQENPEVVGSIFGGLVVANLMMFALGLLACRAFLAVLKLKRSTLITIILLLCFVGTYALERSIFDIWVMWFFGAIGYIMREFNFPLPPCHFRSRPRHHFGVKF